MNDLEDYIGFLKSLACVIGGELPLNRPERDKICSILVSTIDFLENKNEPKKEIH